MRECHQLVFSRFYFESRLEKIKTDTSSLDEKPIDAERLGVPSIGYVSCFDLAMCAHY